MAKAIKKIAKPSGYEGKYAFFLNNETGRKWKAKVTRNDVDTNNIGVTITASPVDDTGHALVENGLPLVTDSWTHTFNETEMKDPGFDAEARLMDIIEERINTGEHRLTAVKQLDAVIKTME